VSQTAKSPYPEVSTVITVLFNFYVFIWWLEIGKRVPFCAKIRLEFLVGAILGVLALYRFFSNPDRSKHNSDIATIIIIYLLVLLISVPLAVDVDVAWNAYVNRVFKFALMSFFISQFVTSPKTLKFFCFSSFLAFFKVGQEALYGKLTGSMVWYNQGIPRLHGPPNTMFGHPNSLSGKTLSLLPFLWYLFPVLKNKWVRLLILIQLVFSVNILIFTGSRTGYVTCIVMLIVLGIMSQKKWRTFLLILLVAIIAIETVPGDYKERFLSAFTGQERVGHSKAKRLDLLRDSLRVFLEYPLGVGLFCFPIIQQQEGRNPQETHNLYTQILSETGIQGAIGFLFFISVLWKKMSNIKLKIQTYIRNISKLKITYIKVNDSNINKKLSERQSDLSLLLAIINATQLFIITRLILGFFGHDLLEIYWWIAAGLVIAVTNLVHVIEKELYRYSCFIDPTKPTQMI